MYLHTYIHIYITHTYTDIHTCIHTYIRTCIRTCVCVFKYIYIYIFKKANMGTELFCFVLPLRVKSDKTEGFSPSKFRLVWLVWDLAP